MSPLLQNRAVRNLPNKSAKLKSGKNKASVRKVKQKEPDCHINDVPSSYPICYSLHGNEDSLPNRKCSDADFALLYVLMENLQTTVLIKAGLSRSDMGPF